MDSDTLSSSSARVLPSRPFPRRQRDIGEILGLGLLVAGVFTFGIICGLLAAGQ